MDLLQHLMVPVRVDATGYLDTRVSQHHHNEYAHSYTFLQARVIVEAVDIGRGECTQAKYLTSNSDANCSPLRRQDLDAHESSLAAITATPQQERTDKLCFFWYHFGSCDRDPANPKRPDKTCPHVHSNEPECKTLSKVGRWMHKLPCGLDLCPWKAETWVAKKKGQPTNKSTQDEKSLTDQSSKTMSTALQKITSEGGTKRKKASSNSDVGRKDSKKQKRMSNRDIEAYSESTANETCFFWYHGDCKKPRDAHRNYRCDHLHTLTDPPTMVQPPPGYIHRRPCGLAWCPGNSTLPGKSGLENHKQGPSGDVTDVTRLEYEDHELEVEAVVSDGDEADEAQEWYLSGFEEPV